MAVRNKNSDHDYWTISDLASHLPEEMIARIDVEADDLHGLSSDRIKRLALQKRENYLKENEETPMKKSIMKKTVRVALVAAMIGVMSVAAFATAFGGLDFIKGIFGESAHTIQDQIVTPLATASADGRDLTLEALVTDGYVTNLVVSLSGSRPDDSLELFDIQTNMDIISNSWYALEEFSSPDRAYYAVELVSTRKFDTADVVLSLNPDVAPIVLSFEIQNNLGNAVVKFPDGAKSGDIHLEQLQISSMGFLLIGAEENAQGGLPSTKIRLVFSDGTTEDMEVEFDSRDFDGETVGGGGGVIIGGEGQTLPLVSSFQGTRNPDGELVITGQFSRIINPLHIQSVLIDGTQYAVQP